MNQDSIRSRDLIILDSLSFEVVSYKIDHVKTVSSYFTVSNNTGMYTNGIKPYLLTVKGYFPKADSNTIVSTLEDLLQSSTDLSFTIDSLKFSDATISKYSFSGQTTNVYQECLLTFMGITIDIVTTEDALTEDE